MKRRNKSDIELSAGAIAAMLHTTNVKCKEYVEARKSVQVSSSEPCRAAGGGMQCGGWCAPAHAGYYFVMRRFAPAHVLWYYLALRRFAPEDWSNISSHNSIPTQEVSMGEIHLPFVKAPHKPNLLIKT